MFAGYTHSTAARVTAQLLAAALIVTSACAPRSGPSPSSTRRIRIAGIVFQEDQFFRLVLFGMRQAAREAGVELLEANSQNKPEKEIELVNTYAAQGVDAICISPLSQRGSVAALKQAKQKGVVIIADNTPVEGDVQSSYIECNAGNLGEQTGKAARSYIQQTLGGKANLAIIAFDSEVPEQSKARTQGFLKQVADLPGVRIVAKQDAWLPEQAVRVVTDILTAHPEINLIWAANEGGTIGAVMAVKNAGKAGKIAVFGTDASEQLLDFLLSPDNILQAITSQRPVEVGRLAVQYALKVLRKEPVPKIVSMEGILLTRKDPAGVTAFRTQLQKWIASGSR
ncbi:MAG: substrate-binding domain-containing protein [Chthonomonadales bacterium]